MAHQEERLISKAGSSPSHTPHRVRQKPLQQVAATLVQKCIRGFHARNAVEEQRRQAWISYCISPDVAEWDQAYALAVTPEEMDKIYNARRLTISELASSSPKEHIFSTPTRSEPECASPSTAFRQFVTQQSDQQPSSPSSSVAALKVQAVFRGHSARNIQEEASRVEWFRYYTRPDVADWDAALNLAVSPKEKMTIVTGRAAAESVAAAKSAALAKCDASTESAPEAERAPEAAAEADCADTLLGKPPEELINIGGTLVEVSKAEEREIKKKPNKGMCRRLLDAMVHILWVLILLIRALIVSALSVTVIGGIIFMVMRYVEIERQAQLWRQHASLLAAQESARGFRNLAVASTISTIFLLIERIYGLPDPLELLQMNEPG